MIEILNGGVQSTLQDAGRPGHRNRGIPAGGAADRLSFGLANWSVGNAWDAPAIECALGGLHVRFQEDTVIALCGADMWAQINGKSFPNNKTVSVSAGDILTLSQAHDGARCYLAVAGGLSADRFLGSVATYLPASVGGYQGRALKSGDKIELARHAVGAPQTIPKGYRPRLSNHVVLRVVAGPEFDVLTLESQRQLFVGAFTATPETDRMGTRLKGEPITTQRVVSMVSGPLLPGTVQVPNDGKPIVSLIDGHCTGGYPRVLQIIRADLWQTGQIRPHTQISFRRCLDEDAHAILRGREAFYAAKRGGLMPGFRF